MPDENARPWPLACPLRRRYKGRLWNKRNH
jgi:hypothetical protein